MSNFKVYVSDYDYPDISIEKEVLEPVSYTHLIEIGKGHLRGFCRRKSEVDGKLGFSAAVVSCDDGDPPGKQHPLSSFPQDLLV